MVTGFALRTSMWSNSFIHNTPNTTRRIRRRRRATRPCLSKPGGQNDEGFCFTNQYVEKFIRYFGPQGRVPRSPTHEHASRRFTLLSWAISAATPTSPRADGLLALAAEHHPAPPPPRHILQPPRRRRPWSRIVRSAGPEAHCLCQKVGPPRHSSAGWSRRGGGPAADPGRGRPARLKFTGTTGGRLSGFFGRSVGGVYLGAWATARRGLRMRLGWAGA